MVQKLNLFVLKLLIAVFGIHALLPHIHHEQITPTYDKVLHTNAHRLIDFLQIGFHQELNFVNICQKNTNLNRSLSIQYNFINHNEQYLLRELSVVVSNFLLEFDFQNKLQVSTWHSLRAPPRFYFF